MMRGGDRGAACAVSRRRRRRRRRRNVRMERTQRLATCWRLWKCKLQKS
jgi:hypothetical protein